ncbi:MAG: ABC transporter permease subunit [Dehalococcoidia bacterium]|nr:ABC transporter permease subunit [Dehalococcoidia bacterium]
MRAPGAGLRSGLVSIPVVSSLRLMKPGRGWPAGAGFAIHAAITLLPVAALAVVWLARFAAGDWSSLSWAVPSGRSLPLLANSLALAVTVAAIASVLGAGLALWIHNPSSTLRRLVRRIYLVPLLLPPYLLALIWMALVGRRQLVDQVIALVIGPGRLSLSSYGFWSASIVLALALSPIVTFLVLLSLEAIEPELVEEASLLRPDRTVARKILLPLVAPGILAGAGLVFVLALVEYGVPSVLQYNVYVMDIYASFSQDSDPLRAVAASMALLVPAVAVVAGSRLLMRGDTLRGQPRRPLPIAISEWPVAARAVVQLGVVASLAAVAGPVLVLALRTGSPPVFLDAAAGAAGEIALTLGVAAVSATAAGFLAVAAAVWLGGNRRLGRMGWLMCAVPLAFPAPLTGIASIYLWNQPWFDWGYGTPFPLVMTHLARLLPFALFGAAFQVSRIDPILLEAASLHNVGWWKRAWRVRLPLLAPAITISWLVVFVLSLGELGASLMVAPPGQATLAIRIYNYMHYGATDVVAALSLVILVAAALAGGAALAAARALWPRTA